MENLTASMRSASELLERRRAEGTGRYADFSTENSRLSRPRTSQVPPTTSYRSTANTGNTGANNNGSLWGLLDMAQSWIMKSRRDRSEEKVKSLIRKSRQY